LTKTLLDRKTGGQRNRWTERQMKTDREAGGQRDIGIERILEKDIDE
jgi:hypothetical protein